MRNIFISRFALIPSFLLYFFFLEGLFCVLHRYCQVRGRHRHVSWRSGHHGARKCRRCDCLSRFQPHACTRRHILWHSVGHRLPWHGGGLVELMVDRGVIFIFDFIFFFFRKFLSSIWVRSLTISICTFHLVTSVLYRHLTSPLNTLDLRVLQRRDGGRHATSCWYSV